MFGSLGPSPESLSVPCCWWDLKTTQETGKENCWVHTVPIQLQDLSQNKPGSARCFAHQHVPITSACASSNHKARRLHYFRSVVHQSQAHLNVCRKAVQFNTQTTHVWQEIIFSLKSSFKQLQIFSSWSKCIWVFGPFLRNRNLKDMFFNISFLLDTGQFIRMNFHWEQTAKLMGFHPFKFFAICGRKCVHFRQNCFCQSVSSSYIYVHDRTKLRFTWRTQRCFLDFGHIRKVLRAMVWVEALSFQLRVSVVCGILFLPFPRLTFRISLAVVCGIWDNAVSARKQTPDSVGPKSARLKTRVIGTKLQRRPTQLINRTGHIKGTGEKKTDLNCAGTTIQQMSSWSRLFAFSFWFLIFSNFLSRIYCQKYLAVSAFHEREQFCFQSSHFRSEQTCVFFSEQVYFSWA